MEPGEIIDELLENGHFKTVYKLSSVRYFDFNYDLAVVCKLIELKNLVQAQIYIEKFKPDKVVRGYIKDCIEENIDIDPGTCTRSKSSPLEFIKSYYDII
jgi:hypothetical protein